ERAVRADGHPARVVEFGGNWDKRRLRLRFRLGLRPWLLTAVSPHTEQAQQDIVALRPGAGVPLEPRPLEVLDGHAVLDELFADGVAEDGQPAVLLPVGLEPGAQVVAGLFEEGAALNALDRRKRLGTVALDGKRGTE